MGFLGELRQEKEARERVEAGRRRMEEERKRASEGQRIQLEQAEKQRREARREQAQQFRDKSGIRSLVEELRQLIVPRYYQEHSHYERPPFEPRDEDSIFDTVQWDEDKGRQLTNDTYRHSGKLIVAETCTDGIIQVHGGFLGSSTISSDQWRNNKGVLESALEKAYHRPIRYTRIRYSPDTQEGRGPCLPGYVLISTLSGLVPMRELKVGDYVWTVDKFGNRISTVIIRTSKVLVKRNHKMLHTFLSDGRELLVSSGHPDISGNPLSEQVKGKHLDGAVVISVNTIPYKEKYTYDILSAGSTGGYWANDILIGSTLSWKFNYKEAHPFWERRIILFN